MNEENNKVNNNEINSSFSFEQSVSNNETTSEPVESLNSNTSDVLVQTEVVSEIDNLNNVQPEPTNETINEANLGITPTNNGEMIILTIPELNEERRREYVKQAKQIGEEGKVAIRNVRQDANNDIKKQELPEDEEKLYLDDIQELTNKYNKIVEDKIKEKEEELMHV